MIKAIETRYKGYRFRSRLEARWAVFFDALKIRWTYEPEGFVLPDGRGYLPDFFLQDFGLFVEIKPESCNNEEHNKALEKYYLFAQDHPAIALIGTPGPINESTFQGDYVGETPDSPYFWCVCPVCNAIGFEFDGRAARLKHRATCEFKLYKEMLHKFNRQIDWNGQPNYYDFGDKAQYSKAVSLWYRTNVPPKPEALVMLENKYRHKDKLYNIEDPLIIAAYTAARSARFEHGETPL